MARKYIRRVSKVKNDDTKGYIINSTNVTDKEKNTYSANIIDNLTKTVTNDNGTAIKFPDGTMICTKKVDFYNVAVKTTWGNVFMSDVLELGNFAETFSGAPVTTITPMTGTACWIATANIANASYCSSIRVIRTQSTDSISNVRVNIMAVGRWK